MEADAEAAVADDAMLVDVPVLVACSAPLLAVFPVLSTPVGAISPRDLRARAHARAAHICIAHHDSWHGGATLKAAHLSIHYGHDDSDVVLALWVVVRTTVATG